jgi:pyruvate formate lyase activating enzyme
MVSRREFLEGGARFTSLAGAAALASPLAPLARAAGATIPSGLGLGASANLASTAPRARYWATAASTGITCLTCHTREQDLSRAHQHEPSTVTCLLCAQRCVIEPRRRGKCRARENVKGELRSLVYGRPVTTHVDPIEKKPFYHFLPGSDAFSLATTGCPLRCRFCQNWEISQAAPEDFAVPFVSPTEIVSSATSRGVRVIAFTYNEPTVFTEYLLDVAAEARARGLRSVLVSCGFMNETPLADMCRALDAIKVDLKGFSERFYRDVSGASLAPVLRSLKQIARARTHLEIVNLVVPTLNDTDRSLEELAHWVVGELGEDVPIHFTRFHPDYLLRNLPPTPVVTLERARAIAQEAGVRYAYVGNVPGHQGNHTYCPKCRRLVIERSGFFVTALHVERGRCRFCGTAIAGVWA